MRWTIDTWRISKRDNALRTRRTQDKRRIVGGIWGRKWDVIRVESGSRGRDLEGEDNRSWGE